MPPTTTVICRASSKTWLYHRGPCCPLRWKQCCREKHSHRFLIVLKKNIACLSTLRMVVRRISGAKYKPGNKVRGSAHNPKTNSVRRRNHAIHDDSQARGESGPPAQGTDGCDSKHRSGGCPSRNDGRERRACTHREGRTRPAFRRATDCERRAFHRGQGGRWRLCTV